jgi:hypothetical protein
MLKARALAPGSNVSLVFPLYCLEMQCTVTWAYDGCLFSQTKPSCSAADLGKDAILNLRFLTAQVLSSNSWV